MPDEPESAADHDPDHDPDADDVAPEVVAAVSAAAIAAATADRKARAIAYGDLRPEHQELRATALIVMLVTQLMSLPGCAAYLGLSALGIVQVWDHGFGLATLGSLGLGLLALVPPIIVALCSIEAWHLYGKQRHQAAILAATVLPILLAIAPIAVMIFFG